MPYFLRKISRSCSLLMSMTSVNLPVAWLRKPATFSPVQMLHLMTGVNSAGLNFEAALSVVLNIDFVLFS